MTKLHWVFIPSVAYVPVPGHSRSSVSLILLPSLVPVYVRSTRLPIFYRSIDLRLTTESVRLGAQTTLPRCAPILVTFPPHVQERVEISFDFTLPLTPLFCSSPRVEGEALREATPSGGATATTFASDI